MQTNQLIAPQTLIESYFHAFANQDIEQVLSLLSEDVVWHIDGQVDVSTVGLLKGKEQVRRWLLNFPKNFNLKKFTIEQTLEHGNNVLVMGRFRHIVQLTQKPIDSDYVIKFTVENNKITRYQIFEDSYLLANAFNSSAPEEYQLRINGTVYNYTDQGEGPVLVFTHGLFVDRHLFDAQIEVLKNNYRCIAIDMPAHNKSSFNKEGWTLESISDDLALMIEELALEQVTFIGQSQGAMVGMRLAAKYPQHISKLVVMGASPYAEYAERLANWQSLRNALTSGSQTDIQEAFTTLLSQINNTDQKSTKSVIGQKLSSILSHNTIGLALAIDAAVLNRTDIQQQLPQIQAATLVICGEKDNATPIEASQTIEKLIPNATLALVFNAGHHAPVEAPQETLKVLQQFLLT